MLLRLHHAASALSVAAVLFAGSLAQAASWQSLPYGGSTKADYYVPDKQLTPRPVLVALHYCGGTGPNARSWWQSYSDQYGFIIITPTAGGSCFDAAASRAGERAAVASMVDYVIKQKSGDPGRVFAAGLSSGACMAHALIAAYPDVFAAGSSLAGVPAGAWTGGNEYGWSTSGVSGAQAWGDKARNADPGYTGQWGRMQIWHGEADTNLTYSQNYPNEVAQWTNVHGLVDGDGMQTSVKPSGASNTWNRTSYSKNGIVLVEANHTAGVDHDLGSKGLWGDVIRFFELDKSQADTTYGKGGMGGTGGMGSGGQPAGGTAGTGMSAGGVPGAGGAPGGAPGVGGAPGGAPGAGGMGMPAGGPSTGGTGTAGASTGGTGGTGNTAAGTGGTGVAAAGATGVAGTSPAAGRPGMGAGGTGGSAGTGGTTGGTAPSAGRSGNIMGGAGTGSGASPGTPIDDAADTGCGCRVGASPGGTEGSALAALGLSVLGLALRRRRSAARR